MTTMAAGDDLFEVAGAYEELAHAAQELAEAVEREDRSSTKRGSRSERAA
jgi:hypothetical protein